MLKIEIPPLVTTIGSYAFEDCLSLTEITIPSSVIEICQNAFHNCTSLIKWQFRVQLNQLMILFSKVVLLWFILKFLHLYQQLVILLFMNAIRFKEVSLKRVSIGNYAFMQCYSLKQIEIPFSVIEIGSCVFNYCSTLKRVSIPSRLVNGKLKISPKAEIITIKNKNLLKN